MVEMASGILHNVRNTLNPMIVDIDAMRQKLRQAPIKKMALAREELAEGNPSPERRKDLARFIELSDKQLSALIQETQSGLEHVLSRAANIEGILPDRDRLTQWKQTLEPVQLDKLVKDAAALIPNELRGIISLTMEPSVAEVGRIKAHRISLLHVVSNLLINSAESVKRSGSLTGWVSVSAYVEEVDGLPMVHLEIRDDGKGIDLGDLDRIFERGFTTKHEGSPGIGLHWSANTIGAMNGRLFAESDGIGYGACFHLMLPMNS
jgi:signal transduction histidine kinase